MEVDLFPISAREKKSTVRAKKKQASSLVQENLNGKNAKRYLLQLLNTNFGPRDLHVTLTYADGNLPDSPQRAEKDLDNFLRRIRYRAKQEGQEKFKYIAVMEYRVADEADSIRPVRYHHHVILQGGLDRDAIEALWGKGISNADRLQLDNESMEALAGYLTKYPKRRRRWKQSRGLKKPVRKQPNDTRWTVRRVDRLSREGEVYNRALWRRKFPGWELNDARPVYNECTGEWSIYLKMRRSCPSWCLESGGAAKVRQS